MHHAELSLPLLAVTPRAEPAVPDACYKERSRPAMSSNIELTVIEPPPRRPRLGLREIWRYRSIAAVLTRRNLKVRYRQTALGVAWVLVQPLALMLVFSVFFSLIGRYAQLGVPFPVFYLCALWIWLPCLKVINEGVVSLITNQQLVTRVYVPRALIPLSVALSTFVDLLFIFIAFQIILFLFGYFPDTLTLLLTPLIVAIAYAMVTGMAYFSSAINTRYRDAGLALPFMIQIWFFLSPIIYPAQWVPEELQPVYYLNPMALVITASRWIFADMAAPPGYAWILAIVIASAILVGGFVFFKRREPSFADEL
jgi:lipopolysaccharide transport system permease protein